MTDDAADEIMERIVRSATQGPSQRTQPRERRRSRANRKSCTSTVDALYPFEVSGSLDWFYIVFCVIFTIFFVTAQDLHKNSNAHAPLLSFS